MTQLKSSETNPFMYDLGEDEGTIFKCLSHVPTGIGRVSVVHDKVHVTFTNKRAQEDTGKGCVGTLFLKPDGQPFGPESARVLGQVTEIGSTYEQVGIDLMWPPSKERIEENHRFSEHRNQLEELLRFASEDEAFRHEIQKRFDELRGFEPDVWESMVDTRHAQLEVIKRMATKSVEGLQSGNGPLELNGRRLPNERFAVGAHGQFRTEFWNGKWAFACRFRSAWFEGYLGGIEVLSTERYTRDGRKHMHRNVRYWHADTSRVRSALARAGLPVELIELYPGREDGGVFRQ